MINVEKAGMISTYKEYERWLHNNSDKVLEYIKANDIMLKDLQLSARTYNALRLNQKVYLSDIVLYSDEDFFGLEMMDKYSAQEIIILKKNYLRKYKSDLIKIIEKASIECEDNTDGNTIDEKASDENSLDINKVKKALEEKEDLTAELPWLNTRIEELDLPGRSYNALKRAGINFVYEAIAIYPDGFFEIRNMGAKSVEEISFRLENFVKESQGKEYTEVLSNQLDTTKPMTLLQLSNHPFFAEKANEFVKIHDVPVYELELSIRSINALRRAQIPNLSDLLKGFPNNLYSIRNLGEKSIDEIKTVVMQQLENLDESAFAFCSGDMESLYSDDYILQKVMKCFENAGFSGISFPQVRGLFPEEFNESRIKKCIGRLLAEKKLEYVDFRLHKVYPSFLDVLELCDLTPNVRKMIRSRIDGETLEEIASEHSITRERVRQQVSKNLKKIKLFAISELNVEFFDEDYYAYLFSNYEVEKELWRDYLGVSTSVFNFLVNTKTKGKAAIKNALSDSSVDLALKFKIQDYLNRNKILLNGVMVDKNRSSIEDFVLSQLCKDELNYEEFAHKYNGLLKENGIPYDEKIYYTDEVLRTRANRLSESMKCLWKQGERVRYYDIDGHDYEELFDVLRLDTFINTEISTVKFINDYPDLMKKYDIRDQYELHNLLKKIVDVNNYHDLMFGRQPMIQFGEFDRTQAIYEIIATFSPISSEDLANYTYTEYGYDKGTALATYFQPLKHLYHNGYFSVDFKPIPSDRAERLKALLTEEIYYFDDIKAIYFNEFGNADIEEINHRSLKALGYNVFGNYILKTHSTAESYFSDILLKEDIFSIEGFNKYHGNNRSYHETRYDLRRKYDILVFDEGQYINFRRLEKLGITKNDIIGYCNTVYNLVEDDEYFTVYSLRELNISSKLDELGFDDIFFENVLAMSQKFQYTRVFGKFVFYKGNAEQNISKKSFVLSLISRYNSVDIDQFKDDCSDVYGVIIPERSEITRVILGTDFYYDEIMDKIYRNKSFYYSEFDD